MLLRRDGRLVTTLRGRAAEEFLAEVAGAGDEEVQQLYARPPLPGRREWL